MACSQAGSYPFSQSSDDYPSSIQVDNGDEPSVDMDNNSNCLISQVDSKIKSITTFEAQKNNLHEDAVYNRLAPIDVLVLVDLGIGKSCLLKTITNDPDIKTSGQLDHVTKELQSVTKQFGKLTYRFWDTKGIDSWTASTDDLNFLYEIQQRKMNPLFVIYCSSGNGRVNSDIVTKLLKHLKGTKTPVAYVITNIYSHNNEQLKGQIDGGLCIMEAVYCKDPVQKNKYNYEFDVLKDNEGNIIRDGKGALIAVNSEPYINDLTNTNKPKLNIYELMSFIANNLDDEDLAKFVALTLANRGFGNKLWINYGRKFTNSEID